MDNTTGRTLFDTSSYTPLAHRLRPKTLDDVLGQRHILAADAPFRRTVEEGRAMSVIFWGPPGCGKTTLANLLAKRYKRQFLQLSAVDDGLPKLRNCIRAAETYRDNGNDGAVLFVDEIHRWNTAQQDALLPHVESGLICLVGATTENPYRSINPALRSRCQMQELYAVEIEEMVTLLHKGAETLGLTLTTDAAYQIAHISSGDARRALTTLERLASLHNNGVLDLETIQATLGDADLRHDPTGDSHYDITSAFIKCMRDSDPDAALYWMARLILGGEDPMFIARRMVIFASEDIGNADLRALPLAVACLQTIQSIGMPEGQLTLGQTCAYLSSAPKSNASTVAIMEALACAKRNGPLPVPLNIGNRKIGYKNPHHHANTLVSQPLWPEGLTPQRFYSPKPIGDEDTIAKRLQWWSERRPTAP